MKKVITFCSLSFIYLFAALKAENSQVLQTTEVPLAVKNTTHAFEAFTGSIAKNKVRLRLQPSFDGQILRELNAGERVIVVGENEDFFAIKPPADIKAYIYRTFVLDNVIEGNKVNVRLKPDLDSPVIAQLNSGDTVNGSIDYQHPKWLAIDVPSTARFFIAKDFVNKIGDAGLMARLEKKEADLNHLLNTTIAINQAEMLKPFDQMHIDGVKSNYEHIILDYPEFPAIAAKAKDLLANLQETYTQKKLAFLEEQSQHAQVNSQANQKLAEELNAHKSKIAYLEQQIVDQRQTTPLVIARASESNKPTELPLNMSSWIPVEDSYFNAWSEASGSHSPAAFYEQQRKDAFILKGTIDAYNRPVKNKPGDFMLVNSSSKLPIAFLYSTQINLQDYIGHDVSVLVSPRPNNHFAFPAYYVLSFE